MAYNRGENSFSNQSQAKAYVPFVNNQNTGNYSSNYYGIPSAQGMSYANPSAANYGNNAEAYHGVRADNSYGGVATDMAYGRASVTENYEDIAEFQAAEEEAAIKRQSSMAKLYGNTREKQQPSDTIRQPHGNAYDAQQQSATAQQPLAAHSVLIAGDFVQAAPQSMQYTVSQRPEFYVDHVLGARRPIDTEAKAQASASELKAQAGAFETRGQVPARAYGDTYAGSGYAVGGAKTSFVNTEDDAVYHQSMASDRRKQELEAIRAEHDRKIKEEAKQRELAEINRENEEKLDFFRRVSSAQDELYSNARNIQSVSVTPSLKSVKTVVDISPKRPWQNNGGAENASYVAEPSSTRPLISIDSAEDGELYQEEIIVNKKNEKPKHGKLTLLGKVIIGVYAVIVAAVATVVVVSKNRMNTKNLIEPTIGIVQTIDIE